MTDTLTPGTKVLIATANGAELATVLRPKGRQSVPSADWRLIRFDSDGATLCAHRNGLEAA